MAWLKGFVQDVELLLMNLRGMLIKKVYVSFDWDKADGFTGELIECDEGELAWVDKTKVPELPTWEGDRVFLDLLLSGEQRFFSIKLRYEGDKLVEKQVNLY